MDKRKTLHDNSMVVIFFSILGVFTFVRTLFFGLIDGSIEKAMATLDASLAPAMPVILGISGLLMIGLIVGGILIGYQGLKVSREPNDAKGYITAAKAFLVLSVISVLSNIVMIFDNNADVVDTVFSLANAVLDVAAYFLFIKAANAVRTEYIESTK